LAVPRQNGAIRSMQKKARIKANHEMRWLLLATEMLLVRHRKSENQSQS
jgi:hypothetical protein